MFDVASYPSLQGMIATERRVTRLVGEEKGIRIMAAKNYSVKQLQGLAIGNRKAAEHWESMLKKKSPAKAASKPKKKGRK